MTQQEFAALCNELADKADEGETVDRVRFLDCVDQAEVLAESHGLVLSMGQDAVQAIMALAFRHCRVHGGR